MTLIISSSHASNVRRAYHRNAKIPIIRFMKPRPSRPLKLRLTFVHMQGTTSSSSLIVTLTGLTLSTTPLPLALSLPSSKPSVAQQHQILSGQTKVPSSLLSPFKTSPNEWGFQHIMSSPMYPQSNGKADS